MWMYLNDGRKYVGDVMIKFDATVTVILHGKGKVYFQNGKIEYDGEFRNNEYWIGQLN